MDGGGNAGSLGLTKLGRTQKVRKQTGHNSFFKKEHDRVIENARGTFFKHPGHELI